MYMCIYIYIYIWNIYPKKLQHMDSLSLFFYNSIHCVLMNDPRYCHVVHSCSWSALIISHRAFLVLTETFILKWHRKMILRHFSSVSLKYLSNAQINTILLCNDTLGVLTLKNQIQISIMEAGGQHISKVLLCVNSTFIWEQTQLWV